MKATHRLPAIPAMAPTTADPATPPATASVISGAPFPFSTSEKTNHSTLLTTPATLGKTSMASRAPSTAPETAALAPAVDATSAVRATPPAASPSTIPATVGSPRDAVWCDAWGESEMSTTKHTATCKKSGYRKPWITFLMFGVKNCAEVHPLLAERKKIKRKSVLCGREIERQR